MRLRPWLIALVLNCASFAFPLVSALPTDQHTDAELAGGAFDIVDGYEGPAWVATLALFSCLVGLAVGGFAAMHTPSRVARKALGGQAALLLGVTCVALFRHHLLMERITRVTGQTFGGFP